MPIRLAGITAQNDGINATSGSVSIVSPLSSGSFVVVQIVTTGSTVTSVTDNLGNAYVLGLSASNAPINEAVYGSAFTVAGAPIITANLSALSTFIIQTTVFYNVDKFGSNITNGGKSKTPSTTLTLTKVENWGVGALGSMQSTFTNTNANLIITDFPGQGNLFAALQYRTNSGTYSGTFANIVTWLYIAVELVASLTNVIPLRLKPIDSDLDQYWVET